MAKTETDASVSAMISKIREDLSEALSIAKAAEVCALDGYTKRAMTIAFDVEPIVRSVDHLLQAAAAMTRKPNI